MMNGTERELYRRYNILAEAMYKILWLRTPRKSLVETANLVGEIEHIAEIALEMVNHAPGR